jgi:tRNA-dihydrouridine synthase
MCLRHLRAWAAYRGETRAVRQFRKHYKSYLGDFSEFPEARERLVRCESLEEAEDIIERLGDDVALGAKASEV